MRRIFGSKVEPCRTTAPEVGCRCAPATVLRGRRRTSQRRPSDAAKRVAAASGAQRRAQRAAGRHLDRRVVTRDLADLDGRERAEHGRHAHAHEAAALLLGERRLVQLRARHLAAERWVLAKRERAGLDGAAAEEVHAGGLFGAVLEPI